MDNLNNIFYDAGSKYFEEGRYELALESFERCVAENPERDEVYYNIGLVQYKMGDLDRAVQSFQKALQFNSNDSESHYNLGLIYIEKKYYSKAIDCFNNSVRIKPLDFNGYYNLGVVYSEMGDLEHACECINKALLLAPENQYIKDSLAHLMGTINEKTLDDPAKYYSIGLFLAEQNHFEEALDNFRKCLELDPDNIEARLAREITIELMRAAQNKTETPEPQSEKKTEDAEVYFNSGVKHKLNRDYEAALADFKKCLEINPNHNAERSSLYFIITQINSSRNEDPEKYYSTGLFFAEQGKYEDAIKQFEKVLFLQPDHHNARLSLTIAVELAKEAYVQNNTGQNVTTTIKTGAPYQYDDDPEYYYNLANRLAQNGAHEAAINNFKKCLALDPNHKKAQNGMFNSFRIINNAK